MNKRLVIVCFTISILSFGVITPSISALEGTIQVGVNPYGLLYDNINGNVYVANFGSNSISVIDTSINEVVATIPVEEKPRQMTLNAENGNLYVMNSGSNSISVIDTSINEVVATIPVGAQPSGGAYNPHSNTLLVANNNFSNQGETLTIINTLENEVIGHQNGGSLPWGMAFNPINGDIYVTNQNTQSVTVIDGQTNEPKQTIPVGSDPIGIAINPISQKIYVTNHEGVNSGTVSVINATTNEVINTISLGNHTQPIAVTFNSNNNTVYVTDQVDRTVFVIDGSTDNIIGNISTGSGPAGAAFVPETESLYVTNYYTNLVRFYGTDSVNTSNRISDNTFTENHTENLKKSVFEVSDSVSIFLDDESLPDGSYLPLYDSSPYKINKGHIAAKIPCSSDNSTNIDILTGQAPNLTLAETKFIPELSQLGDLCMYHGDISSDSSKIITDIAISNNSTEEIEFPETSSIVINVNEISQI